MVADAVVLRVFVDIAAAAIARQGVAHDFGDARTRAIGHQDDLVGQQNGFVDVMGNHEHGLRGGGADFEQLVLDHAAGEGVERAERFVQQQHLGLDGKGAGNADALLHAARQFRRFFVLRTGQTDQVDELLAVGAHFVAAPVGPARFHREGDILHHRQPRHQGMPLKHYTTIQAGAGHLTPVHEHQPGAWLVESGQHIQDGRFAAAGMADDADEFALIDAEMHVVEHRQRRLSAHTGIDPAEPFNF